MDCREARELMSDYLEQYLVQQDEAGFDEHLRDCGACRQELAELKETLSVVRGLPRQEPVSDLWAEFAVKAAEVRGEAGLGPIGKVRLYFARLFDALSEGWMIFTTTVRYNVRARIRQT